MEYSKVNKNHQSSNQSQLSTSSCCAEAATTTKKNAVRAFYFDEISQLIERDRAPAANEVCLSPLLWSESFGLRLDG